MERWTFLIIADAGGAPSQIRVILRAGEDEVAWPKAQLTLDGREVPVDAAPHDYEAPEWKATQLFIAGGGTQHGWDELKDRLRPEA